ncbi:MAG: sodium:solute symporter [Gemmatimonadota bacterium]|nr:sodium:solute symporter [Gemmatimonadota bacterium]MDH3368574.1 sodium:solute symporter [Gemmatimonadota bacterium]MDH3476837.1 sodium:solute symporter [Gemmatimonadota bacterium]MDH3570505.1 sodium:solute symporter [Gemmatimonadota bacterium]MDH5550483.1 sodium:solute symporter [Gemmatimonadota bacterium]
MTPLDLAVMALYFLAVIAVGVHFTRRQHDASDYFLGRHSLPWWAVMLSIVATETSALTVISIPGLGARTDLTFLQLPLGYLVGRVGVALWLLPGYFRGENETAYTRLEARFGPSTRRIASATFMGIRALGDSVRVFATAIPLSIVTGWSYPASIAVVALATLAYTWAGGIKAVVWVDVMQLGIYLVGGIATLLVAASLAGGGMEALTRAADAGRLKVFDWSLSLTTTYTFLGGLVGGALLSAASHGTDHLIVQRLLATRHLTDARRALVGSGILVIAQFAIFLLVGTMLWAAGADDPGRSGDELFPTFVITQLPPGLAGLVVAGLLAAAMSTVSSSLNSLASATTHDFYSSITGRRDSRHLLAVGRWATVGWAVVLAGGAMSFRSTDQPVVELALSIASITYGALLGTYILAGITAVRQRDAITAIFVSATSMLVIVLGKPGPLADLAWPWYVPLGTMITLGIGWLSSAVRTGARS